MNENFYRPSSLLPPVIISLTAIRSRVHRIEAVLESLRNQTLQPNDIVLSVSEDAFALDEGIPLSQIPEGVRRMVEGGSLKLWFVPNTGPYRKLMPVLERVIGREVLIATADDDTIYPSDWLQGLVETYNLKRCVVAYRCRAMSIKAGRFTPYNHWRRLPVDDTAFGEVPHDQRGLFTLPTGVHGVLYNSKFFPDLALLERLRQVAPLQDDLAFRAATMCLGISATRVADVGIVEASGTFRLAKTDSETLFNSNKTANDVAWAKIMTILEAEGAWPLANRAANTSIS